MILRHMIGRASRRFVTQGAPLLAQMAVVYGLWHTLGCTGARGPKYTPAPAHADEAIINVYRPSANMGRLRVFAVCLDGDGTPPDAPRTCTNVIRNGGYFTLTASPGIHRVWVFHGKSIDVNVEAGKTYYLRFTPLGETFEAVDESQARGEIKDCQLSQVNQ